MSWMFIYIISAIVLSIIAFNPWIDNDVHGKRILWYSWLGKRKYIILW